MTGYWQELGYKEYLGRFIPPPDQNPKAPSPHSENRQSPYNSHKPHNLAFAISRSFCSRPLLLAHSATLASCLVPCTWNALPTDTHTTCSLTSFICLNNTCSGQSCLTILLKMLDPSLELLLPSHLKFSPPRPSGILHIFFTHLILVCLPHSVKAETFVFSSSLLLPWCLIQCPAHSVDLQLLDKSVNEWINKQMNWVTLLTIFLVLFSF